MENVELGAALRSKCGKGAARSMRRAGKTPAILYGPKRQATMLEIDTKEFLTKVTALEGSHLIRLRSTAEGVGDKVALVKDAQYHPVSGTVLHADFYEVDMSEKIQVRVPLHFIGKSAGVALGGILQPVQREVEVECLPADIPEYIEVDVGSLNIHDAIHVSQLQVPAYVRVLFDSDFTLVTVLSPTVEEVKAAEAAPAEAVVEGAAPEAGKAEPEKKSGAA